MRAEDNHLVTLVIKFTVFCTQFPRFSLFASNHSETSESGSWGPVIEEDAEADLCILYAEAYMYPTEPAFNSLPLTGD